MEIEPHPDLIRYFETAADFRGTMTVDDFYLNGEHYNIVSNVEENIFLLRRLDEAGLLRESNHVVDCGMGLGNALFDLYLQSFEMRQSFDFTGIEKNVEYVEFIESRLSDLWQGWLTLINGDIMHQNYSNYNIVYSYSPFNNGPMLSKFYETVADQLTSGSIIIEHANGGKGYLDALGNTKGLRMVDIDGHYVFVKE